MTTWSSLFSGSLPGAAPADIGKVLIVGAGPAWVASFLQASNIQGLGALATLNTVGPAQIDALAVTGPKLADGAVTGVKVAADTLESSKWAPGQWMTTRNGAGFSLHGTSLAAAQSRWGIYLSGGEAAGNVGNDLIIQRNDNNGAYLSGPLTIRRSDGMVFLNQGATVAGALYATMLGVGQGATPSATTPLHVKSTTIGSIVVTSDSSWAGLDLQAAAGQASYVFFKDGGVEKARIMGAGDLVFCTGTGAIERLRVRASDGAILAPGTVVAAQYQASGGNFTWVAGGGNSNIYFDARGGADQSVLYYSSANKVLHYNSNGFEQFAVNPDGSFVARGNFSGPSLSVTGAAYAGYFQAPTFAASGGAGSERRIQFQTGATMRWYMGADASAENGSNNGSNFFIARSNDAGVYMGTSISIYRATGQVHFENYIHAGNLYLRDATGGANWLTTLLDAKGPALGFTPVTQGGAAGMGSNRVYIGWDNASKVILQVDSSPMGQIACANTNNSMTVNNAFTQPETGAWASGTAAVTMGARSYIQFLGYTGMGYVGLSQSQTIPGTLMLTPVNGQQATIYFNMAQSKVQAGNFELISDVRTKSNFNPVVGALDRLMTLPTLAFDKAPYIDAGPDVPRQRTIGTIAQLVRAVLPDAVSQHPDGMLLLNSDALVAVLIEALREVDTQVRVLRGLPPRPPPLTVADALAMVTPEDEALLAVETSRMQAYVAELEARAAEPPPEMPEATP